MERKPKRRAERSSSMQDASARLGISNVPSFTTQTRPDMTC